MDNTTRTEEHDEQDTTWNTPEEKTENIAVLAMDGTDCRRRMKWKKSESQT
jgi:hypothetical protein